MAFKRWAPRTSSEPSERTSLIKKILLASLWEGLPVWIVNSWSEVTEETMAQKAAEIDSGPVVNAGNVIPEKLLLKTWVERIRQAGTAAGH